jgi:hypothetical protein
MTARKASRVAKNKAKQHLAADRLVDEALQQSFPASDPPYFVGAGAGPVRSLHTTKPDAVTANVQPAKTSIKRRALNDGR